MNDTLMATRVASRGSSFLCLSGDNSRGRVSESKAQGSSSLCLSGVNSRGSVSESRARGGVRVCTGFLEYLD